VNKPLFVINFKTYENVYGEAGLRLAKDLEEAGRIRGVSLILCVPATEIARISAAVKIPVYAQHVDPLPPGAHSGWLPPQALLAAGAKGTLLNHSEHRIEDIEQAARMAKQAGLAVIVCVRDALEAKIWRNLPADYIAYEPPELIGGDISVSTAHPDIVAAAIKQVPERLLVGAGVKNREDVAHSFELGAKGVLIASGVVRAAKPKDALLDLASGW
jgi:triosephosphate isomerase